MEGATCLNYTARTTTRQCTEKRGGLGRSWQLEPNCLIQRHVVVVQKWLFFFRKDLSERMDFDPLEHSIDGIGICKGELLSLFH